MNSTAPLNEAVMGSLLRGSHWIGQPAGDPHCVGLAFGTDERAHVTLGFGQSLYFVAACRYELLSTTVLQLTFDSTPEFMHPSLAFAPGMRCAVPISLEAGEFSGVESIVNWPFTYLWRLRCSRPPFPDGVPFPRPLPTEFYGYKQEKGAAASADSEREMETAERAETVEDEGATMSLAEARQIVSDPAASIPGMMMASHAICESADSTLEDLLACASLRFRSAAWRPALILCERTGVARCLDDRGFIIIDVEFWREYIARVRRDGVG